MNTMYWINSYFWLMRLLDLYGFYWIYIGFLWIYIDNLWTMLRIRIILGRLKRWREAGFLDVSPTKKKGIDGRLRGWEAVELGGWLKFGALPLVNILTLWLCQNSYGKWTIYSGFTHWKWWFSIVIYVNVYQRVNIDIENGDLVRGFSHE